ncbi:tetratricopeptide repeat protein [Paludisphaera soli]|uniref:tetratricopeptide repeat protein n=1 Tax=Paludisphaera soli TaxID=2712865 RepID=UPI0013EC3BB9|nr:tetratricopeptide repeat protein [Paludisphaera soli]
MSRARDPFTAAVTAWWSPLMKQHGFRNYSIPRSNVRGLTRRRHRTFSRIANGRVFQYFGLGARSSSPGSGARFHARYASLLIGRLQEEVYSTAGGTIEPEGGRTFADWPADTHGRADDSMVRVRDRAAQEAIPWLDATATVEGLARALAAMPAGENPNTTFELGRCHATLGRVDEAAASLREAIALFQTPSTSDASVPRPTGSGDGRRSCFRRSREGLPRNSSPDGAQRRSRTSAWATCRAWGPIRPESPAPAVLVAPGEGSGASCEVQAEPRVGLIGQSSAPAEEKAWTAAGVSKRGR